MKRRALFWSAVSWVLMFTVLGSWFVYEMNQTEATSCHFGISKTVFVATSDIEPGTRVSPLMFEARDIPERFLPPNYVGAPEASFYMGERVAVPVEEGAMLVSSHFYVGATESGRHPICDGVPSDLAGVPMKARLSRADGARVVLPEVVFRDGLRVEDEPGKLGLQARNLLCHSPGWTIDLEPIGR